MGGGASKPHDLSKQTTVENLSKPQYLLEHPDTTVANLVDLIKKNDITTNEAVDVLTYYEGKYKINKFLQKYNVSYEDLKKMSIEEVDKLIIYYIQGITYSYDLTDVISDKIKNGTLYERNGGKSKQRGKKNKKNKTKKRN